MHCSFTKLFHSFTHTVGPSAVLKRKPVVGIVGALLSSFCCLLHSYSRTSRKLSSKSMKISKKSCTKKPLLRKPINELRMKKRLALHAQNFKKSLLISKRPLTEPLLEIWWPTSVTCSLNRTSKQRSKEKQSI